VLGILAGGSVFLGYVFVRQGWMVYALIPLSAFQALAYPSINALLSRMTDAQHQGALQGGMASLNSVALILAPLMLSQALAFGAERGFPAGNFVFAAALALAALLIVVLRVVPRVRTAPATG
jgi:DHA1 family tetracycline resistance protein-like MFS transporter